MLVDQSSKRSMQHCKGRNLSMKLDAHFLIMILVITSFCCSHTPRLFIIMLGKQVFFEKDCDALSLICCCFFNASLWKPEIWPVVQLPQSASAKSSRSLLIRGSEGPVRKTTGLKKINKSCNPDRRSARE